MSSFHPLEVVGRGSETQLQVGENLNIQPGTLRVEAKYIKNTVTQNLCGLTLSVRGPSLYFRI